MASIQELLKLSSRDIAAMSRSELAKVVTQLDSAANKRLKRLEQVPMGTESTLYKNVMAKGKFTVAGKSQGQLQAEFKRVTAFLRAPTSTAGGFRTFRAKTMERIGGSFSSEDQEREFWKIYRDLEKSAEYKPIIDYGSDVAQRFLRSEYTGKQAVLTEDEKNRYGHYFPKEEQRDLDNLSHIDLAIIRTLIKQEDMHRRKMLDIDENERFTEIGSKVKI